MKRKKTHKDFKAVEFMRKRRDELSDLLESNPKEFWEQLEEIRKQFKNKFHQKIKSSPSIAAESKIHYGKK